MTWWRFENRKRVFPPLFSFETRGVDEGCWGIGFFSMQASTPAYLACMNSLIAISGASFHFEKGGKGLGLLFLRVVFFCYSWLVEEKNRYPGMKFTKLVPRIQLDLYVTKLLLVFFFLFWIFLGWKSGKVSRGRSLQGFRVPARMVLRCRHPHTPWNARFMHGLGKRDEEGGARVFFLSLPPPLVFFLFFLSRCSKNKHSRYGWEDWVRGMRAKRVTKNGNGEHSCTTT